MHAQGQPEQQYMALPEWNAGAAQLTLEVWGWAAWGWAV